MLSAIVAPIVFAQTGDVVVKIDAAKTGAPISQYLYGQFLEHGGDIVNTGVWAEMLQDRKFFYPITVNPPTEPWNPLTAPAAEFVANFQLPRWNEGRRPTFACERRLFRIKGEVAI